MVRTPLEVVWVVGGALLLVVGCGTSGASGGVNGDGDGGGSADGGATDSSRACGDASVDALTSGAGACVGDTPVVVDGKDTGFSTCGSAASRVLHRRAQTDCPNLLAAAARGACTNPSGTCKVNADCSMLGPNAVCTLGGAIAGYCECRAGCVRDADCPSGTICQCGSPIGNCAPAQCATDSQCGQGLLCAVAPIDPTETCGVGVETYVCQKSGDTCFVDSDCPSPCGTRTECVLGAGGARWCTAPCPVRTGP